MYLVSQPGPAVLCSPGGGGEGGETAPTVSTAQVPSLVQFASADVETSRQN